MAIHTTEKKMLLLCADQMMTGFSVGQDGYTFTYLIKKMGLSQEEWEQIKIKNPDQFRRYFIEGDKYFRDLA